MNVFCTIYYGQEMDGDNGREKDILSVEFEKIPNTCSVLKYVLYY